MRKKLIIPFILLLMMTVNSFAFEIPGYEGGIRNEITYKEVVFVTGEPILMKGTIEIRNNDRTERYVYRLENTERNARLTRNVTLNKTTTLHEDQRTTVYSLGAFTETIEVAGVRYQTSLRNVQWSKSNVYQMKPAVTYFAGNWDGRKTYQVSTGGTLTVETRGTVVGYHHHWGSTETQSLQHFIRFEGNGNDPVKWQGTATVEAVHNRTKDYFYEANSPTQISFRGGFLLTEQEENVLKISYDLPRLATDGTLRNQRNIGTDSFSLATNPNNQRLLIPAMRDISGHWAEKDILLLASLEAVYPNNTIFGPNLPMTRGDFARAIAVIIGLQIEEAPPRQRTVRTTPPPQIFVDVDSNHENEKYIRAVFQRGIMTGKGNNRFHPDATITRMEATAILIRALGFENLAPIQQYTTGFRDDAEIPSWGKDYVYVARELGLIQGTNNFFQPNREMTKAEGVTILTNLIHYLQTDLRFDYRERLLNF